MQLNFKIRQVCDVYYGYMNKEPMRSLENNEVQEGGSVIINTQINANSQCRLMNLCSLFLEKKLECKQLTLGLYRTMLHETWNAVYIKWSYKFWWCDKD